MRRDTWQALRSRVVFVNAPLERSESDSSARIGVSILRKISIGTVQIFQYRYLSKYRYFWQHYVLIIVRLIDYQNNRLLHSCSPNHVFLNITSTCIWERNPTFLNSRTRMSSLHKKQHPPQTTWKYICHSRIGMQNEPYKRDCSLHTTIL